MKAVLSILTAALHTDRLIYTIHGPLHYGRAMLVPEDPESREALLENTHVKSVFPLDDALGISRTCTT